MNERETAEQRLDRWIDEHLARLADGERPDLEAAADGLEEPEQREAFRVAVLAEEYMLRLQEGEAVDFASYLERMPGEAGRERLRQYVQDSQRAGRFLPSGLAPGTLLAGKYRIEREIGKGGHAIVYEAFDETLQHEVAIKVFHRQAAAENGTGWEERVRHESQVLASLTSRNIVTIHAAEHVGEHSYLVTDRVTGHDVLHVIHELARAEQERGSRSRAHSERVELLRSILGERPEGEHEDLLAPRSWYRTVARIALRAAHALELAHAAGVTHRDLKPQNLMLVAGGEPVLLDFGLAASRGATLDQGGLFGTLEYLAPEQARSLRTGSDPRTDLYQLGLVLQELLTLERAFARGKDEPLEWILGRKRAGSVRDCAEVDPHLPPALAAICRHALAPEIDMRYRSARELRVDLERFERGLPPRYAPIALHRSGRMWLGHLGRKPAVAASVLFAAVLTAVIVTGGADWVPPALAPFRFEEGSQPELLVRGQVIEASAAFGLGIEVSASSPTVLYAFAIEGQDEAPESRSLKPVLPELYARLDSPEKSFGSLALEPGQHEVACSFVVGKPSSYEGVLVYALEKDDPRCALFDEWQERLHAKHEAEGRLFALNYAQALALGASLFMPGGRGVSGAEVSEEERQRLFGTVETRAEEDDWRELGFKREEFVFQVEIPREDAP